MTEPMPTNAIIASLRLLAGSDPDGDVRQELFDRANELEQVLARTHFAHAPTRDKMQSALWGAEQSLADRLDEILRTCNVAVDVGRETQLRVVESTARLGKLEMDLEVLRSRVDLVDTRTDPDLSVDERRALIALIKDSRERIIALENRVGGDARDG